MFAPFALKQTNDLMNLEIPNDALILDLDADFDVVTEAGNRVISWRNQVADFAARDFTSEDAGRAIAGSGRPTLVTRSSTRYASEQRAIIFAQQELINRGEAAFGDLIRGSGYTWFCVLAPHEQAQTGYVHAFFGNLRNTAQSGEGHFEGFWGGFDDDNTVWCATRNGLSHGWPDENNPKTVGPRLETNRFYVIAARLAAGRETVAQELFVNSEIARDVQYFVVNVNAQSSQMAIGQERNAINHPGYESFCGEISRLLIYNRPLHDEELAQVIEVLKSAYNIVDFEAQAA